VGCFQGPPPLLHGLYGLEDHGRGGGAGAGPSGDLGPQQDGGDESCGSKRMTPGGVMAPILRGRHTGANVQGQACSPPGGPAPARSAPGSLPNPCSAWQASADDAGVPQTNQIRSGRAPAAHLLLPGAATVRTGAVERYGARGGSRVPGCDTPALRRAVGDGPGPRAPWCPLAPLIERVAAYKGQAGTPASTV
jgi:hypothetical protein